MLELAVRVLARDRISCEAVTPAHPTLDVHAFRPRLIQFNYFKLHLVQLHGCFLTMYYNPFVVLSFNLMLQN